MLTDTLRNEFNEALNDVLRWVDSTPEQAMSEASPFLAYLKTPRVQGTRIFTSPPENSQQLFNYPYHDKQFEFSDEYLFQWHQYIEKKIKEKKQKSGVSLTEDQLRFLKQMVAALFLIHEFLHIRQDLHSYQYQDSEKYPTVLFGVDYFADAASILILYKFLIYHDLLEQLTKESGWKAAFLQLIECAMWGMEVFEFGNGNPSELGRNQWFRFVTWHFQYHRCRAFSDDATLEDFSILSQPLIDIRGLRPYEYKGKTISESVDYLRLGSKEDPESVRSDPAFFCVAIPDSRKIPRMCRTWITDVNNIKTFFSGILGADRSLTKSCFDEVFASNRILVGDYNVSVPKITEQSKSQESIRKVIRIGVLLNGNIHYVENIFAGFRSVIDPVFDKTGYALDIVYRYGKPGASDKEYNVSVLNQLISTMKDEGGCDYLVTIGTSVSQIAFEKLIGKIPIIFIGVSDPVKSGLIPRTGMAEQQKNIAGLQYGLSGSDTVNWLNRAFPGKKLAFVYNKEFPQDYHLFEDIRSLAREDLVTLIETSTTKLSDVEREQAKIFFGRFFLCGNMAEFVKNNPGAAFVGVSIDNIRKGAAAACGFNTFELGRLSVERILYQNLVGGVPLNEIPLIVPDRMEWGFNLTALRNAGVQASQWARSQAHCILD